METTLMADPELNKKVAAVLEDERETAPSAHDQVVSKLQDLAAAIEASLVPGTIQVRIEPGYRVNLGQQYSFVFRIEKSSFRDVLLRAYVPVDGFPVTLDLFDETHPECSTLDALEAEILAFLGHRDVKQRLRSLKTIAA
jgi:hypothetical protein